MSDKKLPKMFVNIGKRYEKLADAVENLGILVIFEHAAGTPWPQLVALLAGLKFLLIIPALLYLVLLAPFSIGRRLARRRS